MKKLIYRSECKRAEVWWGNCRELDIPKTAIVFTDPPFNIGKPQLITDIRNKVNGRVKQLQIGQDFGEAFDTGSIKPKEWIPFMPNTVVSFCGAKQLPKLATAFLRLGFEIVQDFHWCKSTFPMPMRGVGFAWAVESGYIFRREGTKHAVNKKVGFSGNYIVKCGDRRHKIHPTQKPVRVMQWLIRYLSLEDSLIVDPFLGSGSTGVAAVKLGRKFVGIEEKEEYARHAARRIKNALRDFEGSFKLV